MRTGPTCGVEAGPIFRPQKSASVFQLELELQSYPQFVEKVVPSPPPPLPIRKRGGEGLRGGKSKQKQTDPV